MKNKIAFVAVGQAGGNIGQLFEQKGFSVLYINTSQEDLDTLEKAKFKYHIPNGEGCNKDRRKAKQLVIDDYDQIAAELEAKIKAELIFVIFASGGGTGSGAGPMLADLMIDDGRTIGGRKRQGPHEFLRMFFRTDTDFRAVFMLHYRQFERRKVGTEFEVCRRFLFLPGNSGKA